MSHFDPISVTARRKEIEEEIARLRKEADEIDIALRVFERFSGGTAVADEPVIEDTGEWTPRPNGTPTNFDMVEFVLSSAEKEGRDGLTAAELVAEIRGRYWPGLVGKQILPSIYQFVKNGRLRKTASGKFKRLKKAENDSA